MIVDGDYLVLDAGRIVESGNHMALPARRGFYARLVERQMTSVQQRDVSVAV